MVRKLLAMPVAMAGWNGFKLDLRRGSTPYRIALEFDDGIEPGVDGRERQVLLRLAAAPDAWGRVD